MADNDYIIENKSKKQVLSDCVKGVAVIAVVSFAAAGISYALSTAAWEKLVKPRLDK